MKLIRIKHKNLNDGVLIAERDFDPAVHERYESSAAADGAPASTGAASAATGDAGGEGAGPSVAERIAELLDGSVAQVETALQGIVEVPMLLAIRDAEIAGKNRKGVLTAIEARNAELAGAGPRA